MRASLCAPFVLLAFANSPSFASTLSIDGGTSALKQINSQANIVINGAANQPAYLLVDLFGGPTTVFNQSIALGFTPFLLVAPLGNTSGAGTINFNAPIPNDASLDGRVVYLVAAVADPNAPGNVDFSNGATIEFSANPFAARPLAGKSLAANPFFQEVRAINQGTAVQIAIDPTIHPYAAGKSAKVHVVAAKDLATWQSDTSLVDVSGDGANVVAFGATNVQSNTFIVDAGTLSGAAGDSIGVGFDVVIDFNQNDQLDAGDFIDGFSDEAGFYIVHNLNLAGPHAVTEVLYSGGTWLGQDLYYPTNIASLGQLPLVVISHGNGHNYQWYDHIGNYLASYGYVVMSHQNNTSPGIETASTTTLTNTDYLLANIATIAGGALVGHLDDTRIFWIGHSRGGEGIARAYDRIFDGTYAPVHFTLSDIKLLSSMAPTDFLGVNSSNPHAATYHLWTGQADADVNGCASSDIGQTFHLVERAAGTRFSTSLHGVGHGDFHASTGSVATGPCLVGKPNTHLIILPIFLSLAEHVLEGNIPAKDFLTRQWEDLKPIGAPVSSCVHVDLQYRDGPSASQFVIDDFQTNPTTALASSGASVTGTVLNRVEANMNDANTDFTNNVADPWNGFTMGSASDNTRGTVFEYNGVDSTLAYTIPVANRNFAAFEFLSLRACQATRHPNTIAVLGDLTFSVTLRDIFGNTSTMNVGAYGGGVEEPYQRTSCGTGTGWANEFETIKLRLRDFRANGVDLELSAIESVEFGFGPSFGASQGRVGLDDIALIQN